MQAKCVVEKNALRVFPIGSSSLPVVVVQPDKILSNRTQQKRLALAGVKPEICNGGGDAVSGVWGLCPIYL